MIIPNKTLAWFGLAGTLSDAVGGLYLTYDLLGGSSGPLGLITRAATYGIILAVGYGLAFGPMFGVIAGAGLGGILALEFWRIAYYQRAHGYSPLYHIRSAGAARGLVVGVAAMPRFGWQFGAIFGLLNACALFVVYQLNFAPVQDYAPSRTMRLNPHARNAALFRALAIGLTGALTGWIESRHVHAAGFGLTIGLVVGLTGLVMGVVSPVVEWWVENLPERTLATVGFALITLGLILQSIQYVSALFGPG
jgi:hypothetical protein